MANISAQNQRLAARYNDAAAGWHRKIDGIGFPAAYRALIANCAADRPVRHLIDIGTGNGDFALAYLAKKPTPHSLTLLDISPQMLAIAQQKLAGYDTDITLLLRAVEDGLIDQRFDTALCAHVMEHCKDPNRALARIFKQLKPGGQLILTVSKPHWCTSIIRLIWRSKAFSPQKVIQMLANAGFTDIQHHPFTKGAPKRVSAGYCASKPERKIL